MDFTPGDYLCAANNELIIKFEVESEMFNVYPEQVNIAENNAHGFTFPDRLTRGVLPHIKEETPVEDPLAVTHGVKAGETHEGVCLRNNMGLDDILFRKVTGEEFKQARVEDSVAVDRFPLSPKSNELHEKVDKAPEKRVRKYVCSICDRVFSYRSLLSDHMHIHAEAKPYTCPLCDKTFCQKGTLGEHVLAHKNPQPQENELITKRRMKNCVQTLSYHCNLCKKLFRQKSELVRHIRVHAQRKPFACEDCGARFRHSSVLISHQLKHRDLQDRVYPFTCTTCNKGFTSRKPWRLHDCAPMPGPLPVIIPTPVPVPETMTIPSLEPASVPAPFTMSVPVPEAMVVPVLETMTVPALEPVSVPTPIKRDESLPGERKVVRGPKASARQISGLIEFMMGHKNIATGRLCGAGGRELLATRWQGLASLLNTLGPHKTVMKWQKVWTDLKYKARERAASLRAGRFETGNKLKTEAALSDTERKVLIIIDTEAAGEHCRAESLPKGREDLQRTIVETAVPSVKDNPPQVLPEEMLETPTGVVLGVEQDLGDAVCDEVETLAMMENLSPPTSVPPAKHKGWEKRTRQRGFVTDSKTQRLRTAVQESREQFAELQAEQTQVLRMMAETVSNQTKLMKEIAAGVSSMAESLKVIAGAFNKK